MNLTLDERTKIFDKVCRLVATKHFDPGMNGVDWNALARDRGGIKSWHAVPTQSGLGKEVQPN